MKCLVFKNNFYNYKLLVCIEKKESVYKRNVHKIDLFVIRRLIEIFLKKYRGNAVALLMDRLYGLHCQ